MLAIARETVHSISQTFSPSPAEYGKKKKCFFEVNSMGRASLTLLYLWHIKKMEGARAQFTWASSCCCSRGRDRPEARAQRKMRASSSSSSSFLNVANVMDDTLGSLDRYFSTCPCHLLYKYVFPLCAA